MQPLLLEQFDAFLPGVFVRYEVLVNGNTRIQNISPSCLDLWELTAADIEAEPTKLWDMVDARDLPVFCEVFTQSGRELTDWVFQWRITTPSGGKKWLHGVGRPHRMEGGGLLWHSYILDITESQQAHDAELISERRFGALLDTVPNLAVQGYDDELVCRYWNSASEHLYGWSRAEAIGRSLLDLIIPPDMRSDVRESVQAMLATGQVIPPQELTLMRQDGSSVGVYSSHVYMHKDRRGSEFFCIDYDLTERQEGEAVRLHLESQLREAQKMEALGTLAGGVAHDFNNIVAAILGNVELALADTAPETESAVSLLEIRKAGRRARELVQQILTFSRRQDNTRSAICVRTVLEDAYGMLKAALPSVVELVVDAEDGLPAVWANAVQMEQVMLNLINNALQAMHGQVGGMVHVSLHSGKGPLPDVVPREIEVLPAGQDWPGVGVCVQVVDNGGGMPPQILSRIFEPFFTTKAIGRGTGLGLAVVHGILREHGASLRVRSMPGQGTAFTVWLPAMLPAEGMAQRAVPIAVVESAHEATAGSHVLYVDDDETMASLMHRLLTRKGYRVTTCSSGAQALEHLHHNSSTFTLCISDYNMLGMSGLALAREIKARWPQLPVAIASGYISDELRQQAPEAGVKELIYKPDSVEELFRSIERLLKQVPHG